MRNKADVEGERWLLGAVQDDPGYAPAHAALADYFQRIGKSAAANYHRQRAGNSSESP
jgi:Tfp pilus assembly protein PilF